MKQIKQRGFSLIELLVVVAIIGVLAAAGILGYQKYLETTRLKTLENTLASNSSALNADLLAIENNLTGRSSLLQDISPADPSNPTCEEVAIQVVINLNKNRNNPFNPSNPVAIYGNAVVDSAGAFVSPVVKGVTLVSCTDPSAVVKNKDSYRLYECTCATDDCSFYGNDFNNPDQCPAPPVSLTAPASKSGNKPSYGWN